MRLSWLLYANLCKRAQLSANAKPTHGIQLDGNDQLIMQLINKFFVNSTPVLISDAY